MPISANLARRDVEVKLVPEPSGEYPHGPEAEFRSEAEEHKNCSFPKPIQGLCCLPGLALCENFSETRKLVFFIFQTGGNTSIF